MGTIGQDPADDARKAHRCVTTRWSVLQAIREGDTRTTRDGIATLFETYWYPLYAFVRRKGYDSDLAQDLVQGYFSMLLERGDLTQIDRSKGKLRSFLMASCSHYLANQAAKERAIKRGGGRGAISIDREAAEHRYLREPWHELTAERLFERRWAISLLEQVLTRLDEEMDRLGKSASFEVMRPVLLGQGDRVPYTQLANRLGITEEAARASAYRLRRRYREILRQEVARTVEDSVNIDEEIQALLSALAE